MAYLSYSGGWYAYARYVLYHSNCTPGVAIYRKAELGLGLLGMLCEAHSHNYECEIHTHLSYHYNSRLRSTLCACML